METLLFSEITKNSGGISIQETVFLEKDQYVEHGHDFYEILFITEGLLIHTVNQKKIPMTKDMLYFIRPGDVHSFQRDRQYQRASLINIAFDAELFQRLCPSPDILGILRPLIRLSPIETNYLLHQIEQIQRVDKSDRQTVYSINCAIILSALSILLTKSRLPADISPPWLEKSISLLAKDNNYILGLKRLVELSGVSQEHLTREMTKHYGITPTKLINQYRLEHACRLLKTNSADITAAAMDSGFSSLSYFNRVFRSVYGCTPTEYCKSQELFGLDLERMK